MKTNFETSEIVTLSQARPALRAVRQSAANSFARAQSILAGINQLNTKPSPGMITTVRGMQCRIIKVLPAGTIEVVSLCGKHVFRVSGLAF